ncbi:MAG: hypothetical protein AAGH40_10770 [Verrucomicrobiota bacterium]
MAENTTPEKFPENEVDNLIADFGKKPEPADRDKLRDMLLGQKDKFKAVEASLEQAKEQGQDREHGRGR